MHIKNVEVDIVETEIWYEYELSCLYGDSRYHIQLHRKTLEPITPIWKNKVEGPIAPERIECDSLFGRDLFSAMFSIANQQDLFRKAEDRESGK